MYKLKSSYADPCLYWRWTEKGVVIWLSWIDDCLFVGPKEEVNKCTSRMNELFDCDDVGEMREYLGCKIDKQEDRIKLTQPV